MNQTAYKSASEVDFEELRADINLFLKSYGLSNVFIGGTKVEFNKAFIGVTPKCGHLINTSYEIRCAFKEFLGDYGVQQSGIDASHTLCLEFWG